MIGSLVVTVPSAAWLWAQGPTKGEGHGHGDHEEHAEHEAGGKEESKDEAVESDEKPKDDQKEAGEDQDKEEDGADNKAKPADKDQGDSEDSGSENGDDKKKDTPPTSDDEGGEDKPGPDAPNQINKPSGGKGAGETSKGSRSATEKKGEKDVRNHPPLCAPLQRIDICFFWGLPVQIAFRLYVGGVRSKRYQAICDYRGHGFDPSLLTNNPLVPQRLEPSPASNPRLLTSPRPREINLVPSTHFSMTRRRARRRKDSQIQRRFTAP
jgi:hypothetical protein